MTVKIAGELLWDLLGEVPAVVGFPSVDELLEEHRKLSEGEGSLVQRRRIGTSKLGEPIHVLTIGTGQHHALVFAGVHPNEPIGGLTTLHLARTLSSNAALRDNLDYTWHIVPCIDPDGMRLNEGWFGGSLSRAKYGRNFYRPAPAEQVEWSFPWSYGDVYFDRSIPETQALMRLIDEVQPTFMCSLHNGEFGGVYYYLSQDAPELYGALQEIPAHLGVELDRGEPERPYMPLLAPGIYGYTGTEVEYDYLKSLSVDPVEVLQYGSSSPSYAARYNTLSLISELPYWSHPDASDASETSQPYAEALRRQATSFTEMAEFLNGVLVCARPDLEINSPFRRASAAFLPGFLQRGSQEMIRADTIDPERLATVAELFSMQDTLHSFRLRYGGILLRALKAEISAGCATPLIREQFAELDEVYSRWCVDAEEAAVPIPIDINTLVAVQFGAILVTASHAAGRFGPQVTDS